LLKKRNVIFLSIATLSIVMLFIIGLLINQRSIQNNTSKSSLSQSEVAKEYEGQSIRFLVPSAPGGGFDEYTRLLAPYLERYTESTIRVVNMPGAGGMKVANELYNSASNGLTIALLNGSAMVINRFAGLKGASYQIDKFEYLGRVNADPRVLTVATASKYLTINDIWSTGESVNIGVTGLGGSGYVDGVISNEAFGFNLQVIHGFDSSSAVRQSMLRGNIAGTWGSWGSAKSAVKSGLERVILQSGRTRNKDLAQIPTTFEYIHLTKIPQRTREILTAWDALNSVGRPIATTPGTAADRVQFLRNAFRLAMHDPEFLEITKKRDRPVHYASGQEMINIINEATQMNDEMEQLFIKIIQGEL
jgi:tripartite-type tricarboxylate transporter receptor subunit TctC